MNNVIRLNGVFKINLGQKYQITLPSGFEFIGKFVTVVHDAIEPRFFVVVFEIEAIGDFNVTVGVHEKIIFNPGFGIKPLNDGGAA